MIVFLSCTKEKMNKRCKAEDMYSASSLFSKCYKYAKSLNPDKIYILSAKHYLLELDDVIDPYNITLKDFSVDERKSWTKKVIKIMKEKHINFNEKCYFLCGEEYIEFLKDEFKNHKCVFDNIGGIGDIMHWLDVKNGDINETLVYYLKKSLLQ